MKAKVKTKPATGYGDGSVVFDTKTKQHLTPGQWKPEDGKVSNISWWDCSKDIPQRVGKRLEFRYNPRRERI